jgi:hypothetical protein
VSWPGFRGCVCSYFVVGDLDGFVAVVASVAGWGGLRCRLAAHSHSGLDRILLGSGKMRGAYRGHGSRGGGVSSVLVQGIRGSFPAADGHRLLSLGCLIAFRFDSCRFERLGFLEDLRGRVYGQGLDR